MSAERTLECLLERPLEQLLQQSMIHGLRRAAEALSTALAELLAGSLAERLAVFNCLLARSLNGPLAFRMYGTLHLLMWRIINMFAERPASSNLT